MGAQLAEQGGSSLFLFTALISINLAVLNALPCPCSMAASSCCC